MNKALSENGSVQVVEMSFVLPIAVGVILALIYLAYAMFMRVHVLSIVQQAANNAEALVGTGELYWQFTGKAIRDEDEAELESSYVGQLNRSCILPGMSADGGISVEQRFHKSSLVVNAKIMCFGKELFYITLDRDLYSPVELVYACDFGKNIESDFEELKEIYNEANK